MDNSGFSLIGVAVVFIVIVLIYIPPLVKILHKAGYSGWWLLLSFIPFVNIVMLWVFAYAKWPALTRLQPPVA